MAEDAEDIKDLGETAGYDVTEILDILNEVEQSSDEELLGSKGKRLFHRLKRERGLLDITIATNDLKEEET